MSGLRRMYAMRVVGWHLPFQVTQLNSLGNSSNEINEVKIALLS